MNTVTWEGKAPPAPGYVLKQYHNAAKVTPKEIEGLQAIDQYVASKTQLLVMKKVTGRTLAQMFKATNGGEPQKAFVKKWKPQVVALALKYATREKDPIYHTCVLHLCFVSHDFDASDIDSDLNMGNIVVDGTIMQFIDWEFFAKPGAKGFQNTQTGIENNVYMAWDSSDSDPTLKGKTVSPKA
ncbi:hypothetical protein C0991_012133 [Blastosporella zonata]|nr:hypothetical protein C0991_012133 [Blastosporella zonata]